MVITSCLLGLAVAGLGLFSVSTAAIADAPSSASGPLVVKPDADQSQTVRFWLESSLKRVYLKSAPGSAAAGPILAPRGGQVSFQACLRNDRMFPLNVTCSITGGGDLKTRVRMVGYVPVRLGSTDTPASDLEGGDFMPGLVPDPLYDHQLSTAGPYENCVFWITVQVPADAKPGPRELNVHWSFHEGTKSADLRQVVNVTEFVVKPRKDFPVVHWFRGEALWDHYKTGMWEDEKVWEIHRNYMENLLSHGTDVMMVPLFFARRETFVRPCQLLIVNEPSPGKYEFDFKLVKRYVDLAKEVGFDRFEWSHFWIYWGARNPVRVYTQKDGKHVMLWSPESDGHGPEFHNFLKQFLPPFHDFLVKEGILEKSYFHVSDEPSGGESLENYRKARAFLNQNAPWTKGKVIDALSEIEYGRENLTDHPIPIISSADAYIKEKIPHWVYFCCAPRGMYLQRLLDTPLPKIRMAGFLFYRLGARGFLHWGYNYWHALEQEKLIDPFSDSTGACWPGIPPGDPFVVYPGPDGKPVDSIRWEVFAEALQDYAILQTAGIKPDDPMLGDIKSYADFPRSEQWLNETLRKVLAK